MTKAKLAGRAGGPGFDLQVERRVADMEPAAGQTLGFGQKGMTILGMAVVTLSVAAMSVERMVAPQKKAS